MLLFITVISVNDCIEDMVTFNAWMKIYSTEYFGNAKVHHVHVAQLGEMQKFCLCNNYVNDYI